MRSTIICVDDDKLILTTLSEQLNDWLGENYTIEKALSGQEALDIIDECGTEGTDVSLVISDYIMPGMKGDTLLEQVRIKSPLTRRIMLTGYSAIEGITNAINKAGIYRYLSKPWDSKDMMLTVLQAIRSYEQDKQTEQLNDRNKALCGTLQRVTVSLQDSLKQTINSMAAAVELREGAELGHAARVAQYAGKLAGELSMWADNIKKLETAALLHDVGKLTLNDSELKAICGNDRYDNKGIVMKQAESARDILSHMEKAILSAIMYHSERADGKGAFGMNASELPIEAKIIGICDYYDTLKTSSEGVLHEDVLASMKAHRGTIFDTSLFDMFSHMNFE